MKKFVGKNNQKVNLFKLIIIILDIEKEFKLFPMDSLIAAGFTIYLSDADENIREKI